MHADKGDRLVTHGRIVGDHDRVVEVVEALGQDGNPPFRVRSANGHETIVTPGPDTEVEHPRGGGIR
ncbi:DUF1918 domain-containing protein [Streptomyces sp. NPDC051320]|uniref:DUF1918 domain-containing protein n=1 Tax=Streptomyces sp. NPDC051320 TaxID=3154644 RepID=UPI00341EA587